MRLDVGALAKGYAVEKMIALLREAGLRSGLINAGGDVAMIGGPLDGRKTWNIGIHAPLDEFSLSGTLDVLRLTDGAVATSGNYQRYFVHDDKLYHHIIDPETLFPAEGVRSVTVLHSDLIFADILSTAAFILPQEKARRLVEEYGAEAIWILADGSVAETGGISR
jgi:thiamine biosynthesis lipoprotein